VNSPLVIVLAGPNGAGKSTAAAYLLPKEMPFLNADAIAKGLPSYPSQAADFEASRILLTRMDDLSESRANFAVETTLASRSLAPRIVRLRKAGYTFRLVFLYLPSPELSIVRVAGRVRLGGHDIPEETIRRRFSSGIINFFELYQPIADLWGVYDARKPAIPRLVASGRSAEIRRVIDPMVWSSMKSGGRDES
jgi:predicted ABC-type ATPase